MATLRSLLFAVFATVPAFLPAVAHAQAGSTSTVTATRADSFHSRGYLGLSLGRSRYNVSCPTIALACDTNDDAARLYGGAMLGNYWGVEVGYLDLGRMAREGGKTRAQGLNLSLVGKAPLAKSFGVFGRVGATYGRTETSTLGGSPLAAGSEHGFGLSYGAGLSYDITPRLSATLEWDSNDFRFAGGGRDPVRSTSLGLQYRY
jgi:opacity protein-like surface antigen